MTHTLPVGNYVIKWRASDIYGNTKSCPNRNLEIADATPPDAQCIANNSLDIELQANGEGLIDTDDIDNGSTDNCTALADLDLELNNHV